MHYYNGRRGWSPHMSPALKVLLFSSEALLFLSFICIALAYNLTNMAYPFAFVLSCWSLMVSIYGLLLYWNKYLAYRLDPSAASDPWIRGYSNLLFITGVLFSLWYSGQ
ncbi:hypothetical protein RvY_14810 [Ramazzottius varieornatus]|uniref:Uncharacterized protein n=1 Tax=Ramazzottius varieornatus TaxID=947166 RepID=A0A1D1VSJ7_RAMVA|nr:hypothetical protein RvY_14810 [Ramazzottius varieornatus]